MRFAGDYDEEFPGQWAFWDMALTRAINGKRGQQALRELRQALLDLPEKSLILGKLAERGQVCTIGALAVHRRVAAGENRIQALAKVEEVSGGSPDSPLGDDDYETEMATLAEGERLGLPITMVCQLGSLNDDQLFSCTPEERYERVLAWVEARIIEEPVAA